MSLHRTEERPDAALRLGISPYGKGEATTWHEDASDLQKDQLRARKKIPPIQPVD